MHEEEILGGVAGRVAMAIGAAIATVLLGLGAIMRYRRRHPAQPSDNATDEYRKAFGMQE